MKEVRFALFAVKGSDNDSELSGDADLGTSQQRSFAEVAAANLFGDDAGGSFTADFHHFHRLRIERLADTFDRFKLQLRQSAIDSP